MDTKVILDEYYNKMNSNKYIGIKEYNRFMDKLYNKYKNEISKDKELQLLFNQENENLEKHNQKYIEQRKAILRDEDSSLIIAGAGSGKTSTMAVKVKYLVER